MNELTVIRYTFEPYFNGYFQEGNFYCSEGKMLTQKYYNGRVCLDVKGKRYGIKKLRTLAKRIEVKEFILPF